jgi:hypothetical protein
MEFRVLSCSLGPSHMTWHVSGLRGGGDGHQNEDDCFENIEQTVEGNQYRVG